MNSFFKIVNDDSDVIRISSATNLVAEGDADGFTDFTVTLSRDLALTTASVDWAITATGDQPLDELRLEHSNGVATFELNALTTTVTLRVSNDQVGDFDRTFRMSISNPVVTLPDGTVDSAVGATIDPQANSVDLTLENDDPAYTLSWLGNGQFAEGDSGTGAFVQFRIDRDGDATGTASMAWELLPVSANSVNISDFGGFWPTGTIAFADGETSKLVQARVAGDQKYEAAESFTVKLSGLVSDVAGARLLVDELVGTITNDDNGINISMATGSESVVEGDGGSTAVTFDVKAVGVAGERVTVAYVIEGFGPAPGNIDDLETNDYGVGTVDVVIGSNGTGLEQVSVYVKGDNQFGPDENLRLRVTGLTNGALASSNGNFVIVNDDSMVSVSRAIGETDTVVEGTSSTPGYVERTFVLTRTGDLTRASVVDYAVTGAGDNPASELDFDGLQWPSGTVTFAPDISTQTVTLRVLSDSSFESTEGFIFRLLPGAPSGSDNQADIDLSASELRTDVVNDDSASISVVAVRSTVLEGTGSDNTLIFRVVRNGSVESDLEVSYALSGDAQFAGSITTAHVREALTGTITIPAGEDTVDLRFTTRADALESSNAFFVLNVTAPGFANPAPVSGAIVDDDSGISARWLNDSVTEGVAGGEFTVVLTRSGTNLGATTVNWAARGLGSNELTGPDWTPAPPLSGTVTFGLNDLETRVTFRLLDDSLVENTEAWVFELLSSSDATQLIRTPSLVGQALDNDGMTLGDDVVSFGAGTDVIRSLAGDDLIYAGAGADLIEAGDGHDVIHGQGGMDQIFGGDGDDVVYLEPVGYAPENELIWSVDGGSGIDMLVFEDLDIHAVLNLDSLAQNGQINRVEVFDIADGVENEISLSLDTVLKADKGGFEQDLGEARQILLLTDANDQVTLLDASSWDAQTMTIDGDTYLVYTHQTELAEIYIQNATLIV